MKKKPDKKNPPKVGKRLTDLKLTAEKAKKIRGGVGHAPEP